jgi:O-antigen/teichoic acid export membrane protein
MAAVGRLTPLAAPTVEDAAPRAQSGTRSGALLAGASAASIVTNYVFLLAAGRMLGSDRYGSLAALLGLIAVVILPATAVQMAVSREISRRVASDDAAEADAFGRAVVRLATRATAPLVVVALVLAVPLDRLLHIHSVGVVVLTELTLVTTFVFPAAMGVLQGFQRFRALAAMYVFPQVLRLVLLALTAAVGLRLGGAIFATMAATVAGTGAAVALAYESLRRGAARPRPNLAPFVRYLTPVAAGVVGIALLTHLDILVVKARLGGDDAGAYGAASAFARVGFFLPATVLAVLFPRTAARQARGEETSDILGRTLLATAAFCGLLALVYAATGVGVVSTTFGSDFAAGGHILAPFALAIGLYSLANVLVAYHLSRGEPRYAWIVGGAVVVQVAVLATLPSSLHSFVWANVAVAAATVVAHEVLVGSSLPALRAGARHFAVGSRTGVRRVALEAVAVLAGVTALVCALFWPLVVHLGSTVTGTLGSDATGSVWWLWELNHESGYHLLGTTHHTLSGAPLGWNEGNGLNLQWLLPYYPAYLLTKVVGEIAAYNVDVLAGYVLSGAAMYLLARYLRCRRAVAAWAALVYVVFPWHLARAEHGSLVHIEVLTLLVLALVAATRRPTWTRFAFVALATLGCWLTSGYYGSMAFITAVAYAAGAAAFRRGRRVVLVAGAAAAATVVTAVMALGAVVSGTNGGAGLNRSVTDLSALALRPIELVVPAAPHLLLGGGLSGFWPQRLHGSNLTEITNYLGLLTFGLAIAWVVTVILRRRDASTDERAVTAGLVTAFVVAFLFAVPSPLGGVSMPSRLLWHFVPAFRVPSRWDPLLMTVLLPLAALGLQTVLDAVSRRWRRGWLAPAVAVIAMAVSFAELAIHPIETRFRTNAVPPAYAAVQRTPPGVLAEYPLGTSDVYRFWQRRHGRPLLNGAAAGTPGDEARLVVLDPAASGTAATLALLGVSAIVLHPHAIVDAEAQPSTPTAGYSLVARAPDGDTVWRVAAPPAAALVTLPGFAPPTRAEDGLVEFPVAAGGGVADLELRARTAVSVRLEFDAEPPGGESRTLRVADSHHEAAATIDRLTHIAVTVAVPRGVSRLLIKTDPAPTSAADAVSITAPRATRVSGAVTLHADLVSSDPGF